MHIDACLATHEGATAEKVADRFLNHRDQKFRLSYILEGGTKSATASKKMTPFSRPIRPTTPKTKGTTEVEHVKNRQALEGFIDRITLLARAAACRLSVISASRQGNPEGRIAKRLSS